MSAKRSNSVARKFLHKDAFFALLLLQWGLLMLPAAAEWQQSIPLRPGWNAVFLEVQPEPRDCETVLADLPVERLLMWNGSDSSVQFIQDPEAILPESPEWLHYVPAANDVPPEMPRLHSVLANHAYLVKLAGDSDQIWNLSGMPRHREIQWTSDGYTFTGLRVADAPAPSFTSYFQASPAQNLAKVFRLDAQGQWQRVTTPESTPIRAGEAYWIYTDGDSHFQGPLTVALPGGELLDFGRSASEITFEVRNQTDAPRACVLSQPESGKLPLSVWDESANEGLGGWRDLSTPVEISIDSGASRRLRLLVNRLAMLDLGLTQVAKAGPGREGSGLLRLSDDLGSEFVLAVAAETQEFSAAERAGLWVGHAAVNAVSENIRRTAPAGPTPTGSEFQFRVIMLVDAERHAQLLRQAVLAWDADGTPEDPDPHFVLLTDSASIASYASALEDLDDAVPAARRVSSVVLTDDAIPLGVGDLFPLDLPPPDDSNSPFAFMSGESTLDYNHPLNPFKHRFHIDHDNLPNDPAGDPVPPEYESYSVQRNFSLAFTPGPPEGALMTDGWGVDVLGGTYSEEFRGLIGIFPRGQEATEPGDLRFPVTIVLSPEGIRTTARVNCDGGPWESSGYVFPDLALGSHTLRFTPAEGYKTPAPLVIDISETGVITAEGRTDGPEADTLINESEVQITYVAGEDGPPDWKGQPIQVAGHFEIRQVLKADQFELNPE